MSKAKFPPDELISTAQAAAELGIGVNRMLVLLNTGRLPAKRLGKFWLIRYADLDLVRNRPHGRPRTQPSEDQARLKKGREKTSARRDRID